MTTAQDVANQEWFLCSPMGAGISGQPISICGNVEYLYAAIGIFARFDKSEFELIVGDLLVKNALHQFILGAY